MITELYLNENFKNNIEYPFEFMTQAIYEHQLNMERIEKAMMLEEYYYLLENGQEMPILESAIGEFFKKIKNAIISLWNKIKEFFKSIFSKSGAASKINKDAAAKAKHTDIVGKKFQLDGYEYIKSADDILDYSDTLFRKIDRRLDSIKVTGTIQFASDTIGLGSLEDLLKSSTDELLSRFDMKYSTNDIFDIKSDTVINIAEILEKECRKKATTIQISKMDIYELENSDKILSSLKSMYESTDKICKKCINELETLGNKYKNDSGEKLKLYSKLSMEAAKHMQQVVQDVAEINRVTLKILNQKYSQTRAIINKYSSEKTN